MSKNLSSKFALSLVTVVAMLQPASAREPSPVASSGSDAAVRVLVLPNGETTLASSAPGRINAVNTGLGLRFRQGDVLVALDCDEPQARLAMAKAELTAATEQHEAKLRMQGLEQASDVEVAMAASAVAKAKAQADLYDFQVSQCDIRAPWDGSTAKLHVRSFMSVTAGQPLLDLVRRGPLLLKLNVPSRWLADLKMGQDFEVAIDETGVTYPARVRRINSRVDPVSQTIEIEAMMLKSHAGLLPGMSGVARFPGLR